ncbi:MAG: PepSY domain-containing protein [Gammaproteobacteria bacterium]
MNKSKYVSRRFLTASAVAAALVATSAAALADVSYGEARKLRADGKALPEERIIELVNKARPGEVTDLELDRDLGRLVYEVEVRDAQGQEWDLELDAASGEVLGEQRDD